MTIYEFFKSHAAGKGSDMMWKTVRTISDFLEDKTTEEDREQLVTSLYMDMTDGHFDKYFADRVISGIVYVDRSGVSHTAPYWTDNETARIYDNVKDDIRPYNEQDFRVVLNMVKADNQNKLERWFPGITDDEMLSKLIDEALNWLDDGDNPYGNDKAFGYFFGKKS